MAASEFSCNIRILNSGLEQCALITMSNSDSWQTVLTRLQVEADTIREFVETQKVWAEQESQRNDEENREIIAFIAKKDQWKAEQDAIAKDRR